MCCHCPVYKLGVCSLEFQQLVINNNTMKILIFAAMVSVVVAMNVPLEGETEGKHTLVDIYLRTARSKQNIWAILNTFPTNFRNK